MAVTHPAGMEWRCRPKGGGPMAVANAVQGPVVARQTHDIYISIAGAVCMGW